MDRKKSVLEFVHNNAKEKTRLKVRRFSGVQLLRTHDDEGSQQSYQKCFCIEIKPRLKMTWKSPDAHLKTEMTRGWE
jgi:hypothetical protein